MNKRRRFRAKARRRWATQWQLLRRATNPHWQNNKRQHPISEAAWLHLNTELSRLFNECAKGTTLHLPVITHDSSGQAG